MILTIKEFLYFATYAGLFDSINLQNYPAILKSIKDDVDCSELVHIENDQIVWPKHEWIKEEQRRKEVQFKDPKFQPKPKDEGKEAIKKAWLKMFKDSL